MQLVILAGGFGTRISEETDSKPKPMVKIGEYPIIIHIMKYFSCFGINDFVVCLGYKGYSIKEYILNYSVHQNDIEINFDEKNYINLNSKTENWNIKLIETGLNTMTGGRIKRIKKYINSDNFFLTYGDGLSNVNLEKLYRYHLYKNKIATVTAIKPPTRFGYLNIKNGIVKNFSEKPGNQNDWINGGFFVLNKKIFDYIKNDRSIWEREPLEKISKKGYLAAYKHNDFWYAMDTLRDKNYLEMLWKTKKAPWKIW